ncbi:MAG: carboxypeptidase regulatory-like domain-containing protein [Longimicrobiales bacterium]
MRTARITLLLLVMAATGVEAQLRGRVVDLRTGDGIADASVRIVAADTQREVFTDRDGAYVVAGLVSAEYAMVVRHPGYDPTRLRVRLGADRELVVDVPLVPQPIALPGLLIPVSRTQPMHLPGIAEDSLLERLDDHRAGTIRARATSPLGDLAAADVREPLPDPGSGQHPRALHIWGSSGDRGRVFVDGASINAPLHLGGVVPPLDPRLLAGVALRTGGASARYDGGTSYIMDFRTRSPRGNRINAWADAGLLATRFGIAAPFDNGSSVMIGARRVNQEVVDALIERPFDYGYGDVLARGQWRAGTGRSASALVLATRESIRIPRDFGYDQASWQNLATALSWQPDAPGAGPRFSASFSRGIAGLPLLSAPDGHLEARLDRSSIAAENDWTFNGIEVDAGIQFEHFRLVRRSEASADPAQPSHPKRVSCTRSLPCSTAATTAIAAFGDVAWQSRSGLAVRAGLRTALETGAKRPQVLPRLALTWVGQGSTAATLSLGRFSQIAVSDLTDGTITAVPHQIRISTQYATQLELRMTHATPGIALAASAYLRRDDDAGAGHESVTTPGAELSWVWLVNGSSLSGGYSILARRAPDPDSTPDPQHLAFVGVGTGRGPVQFDLSGVYGAGVPLTSIVLDRVPGQETLRQASAGAVSGQHPNVRVDATVSGTWTLDLRGRVLDLTPYARIINAFSRHAALFYYQEGGRAELQPLSALPMMPVLGFRLTF